MPDWNPDANDLFLRAAEIDVPADRHLFLDQHCPDPELRAQVESLLLAGAQVGSFLTRPAAEPAKAVEQRLTEKTLFTQYGALVGTFEYMSPEQAEMNAFGVDTRSDVYSLGVLLYELLTGSTPLERQRVREAALGELIRLIKEEEAPRPSLRPSTSGTLAKVAAARKTDPGKLSALVRGELDWIVMRCLEKDRTRRYESASGLARDVERYSKDEAVETCPPSLGYRLKKVYRRNKARVVTTAVLTLALIGGLIGTTWQALRAGRGAGAAGRV